MTAFQRCDRIMRIREVLLLGATIAVVAVILTPRPTMAEQPYPAVMQERLDQLSHDLDSDESLIMRLSDRLTAIEVGIAQNQGYAEANQWMLRLIAAALAGLIGERIAVFAKARK